jgi:pre-rRNA-processing protein TSR4
LINFKELIEEDLDGNNNSEGMDQDLDALKENDYDKDFERFKKISAEEAEQVVRYERGGEPLWCTKYNKLKETQVPACQKCGAKRIFEFQVDFSRPLS